MGQIRFPKETRIIEVNSIDLREKDLLQIKDFEDFVWLTRNDAAIWKLSKAYYALDNAVAYIFIDKLNNG